MLRALGLTRAHQSVYQAVVRLGECSIETLAERAPDSEGEVAELVDDLAALGLVRLERERVVALRPELAINAVLSEREAGLQRARVFARSLAPEFRAEQPPFQNLHVVQIIEGVAAITARHQELWLGAREELCTFERPPYLTDPEEPNEAELVQLDRGVRVRGLVASAALEVPGRLGSLRREVAAGEEVRVLPDLPLKLVIADGRSALLPLMTTSSQTECALLLGPCALLDALVGFFEALWARGLPLDVTLGERSGAEDGEVDRDLLALLAAGIGDSAIARQLGVSERTVRRRVAGLLESLDVRTRFQAGVQARARGLL